MIDTIFLITFFNFFHTHDNIYRNPLLIVRKKVLNLKKTKDNYDLFNPHVKCSFASIIR